MLCHSYRDNLLGALRRNQFVTACSVIIAMLCLLTARSVKSGSRAPSSRAVSKIKQVKQAIILSSQDTGSTWLNTVLDALDGVSFRGERMIGYSYHSYDKWLQSDWDTYKSQLETALNVSGRESVQVVGFKLMYDQLPHNLHRAFAQWLNDNRIYVIHLRRRAAILQWASHHQKVQAMVSGAMKNDHVTDVNAVVQYPKVKFNKTVDFKRIRQLEKNQHDYADYLHVHAPLAPHMELWYEHLDGPNQADWFNAVFSFLGLEKRMSDHLGSSLIKLGERKCEDRIDGLDGPEYESLRGLDSQMACAMLFWQTENEKGKNSSDSFYPPAQNKCRLTPALSIKCVDPGYNPVHAPGKR